MCWSVRKESGAIPACCGTEGCVTCSAAVECAPVERKSYLVVKAEGDDLDCSVAISLFGTAALDAVVSRVTPLLRSVYGSGNDFKQRRLELFLHLQHGLYSSGSTCPCSPASGVCTVCSAVPIERRLFIWRDSYDGVRPLGGGHWFTGVMDAGGIVALGWLPWLFCRHGMG
jgi:hypothetical protein